MDISSLDFEAHYSVDGWRGVAFWIKPRLVKDADYGWTGIRETDPDYVVAVMVGDDREFIVEVEDLTLLADEDYCSACGQIGCGHNY